MTDGQHELSFEGRRCADAILVVDSNPRDADELAGVLKNVGFNIRIAYSGEEAIRQIQGEQPAVVLTYTRMPRVSGWDVLEWVRDRRETCAIPVILMTDNPTDEEVFRGFRRCSDCHLTKPLNIPELITFLDRIVAIPKSTEDLERVGDHMMHYFGPQVEWQVKENPQ